MVPCPAVRQLLPEPPTTSIPSEAYADAPAGRRTADRPWVLVNMVASADGATAVDGRSGRLGGDRPTKQVFRASAAWPT